MKRTVSRGLIRIIGAVLSILLVLPLVPFANAQNDWNMSAFLKAYSDPHFNLANEPNRAMTVEEFIAIMHAYSYYGGGSEPVTVVDKNGKLPSAWCGKYVQAEANKKVFDPERISWNDPVTLAFAAQFMVRSKGKYSYDANNIYNFNGAQDLNADDILYICAAIDYGLISYKSGMDVSAKILRRDARKYEVPSKLPAPKPTSVGNKNTMRELNAYFIDCYNDFTKAESQLDKLKRNSNHITMVTFFSSYINGYRVSDGNRFLACDIEHGGNSEDPQLDAIEFCRQSGKLALLGVCNAYGGGFIPDGIKEVLESYGNMQTAVSEIVAAVEKYELDGVNLGIEITDLSYGYLKESYSMFVNLLSTELHKRDKVLLVSIGAYFTEKQESASFYDYSLIGRAADYVHIILYDDFSDTGYPWRGTHGPISNIVRIKRCIRYASAKMEKSKILLGIGAFAVDFNLTAKTASDISYAEAEALMRRHNAKAVYDNSNNAAGAYFEYTDSSSNLHRVYFETGATAAQRADVVKDNNLCGFSVFNLTDDNIPVYNAIASVSSFKNEVTSSIASGLVPTKLRSEYDKPILRREFCSVIVRFIESKSGMSAEDFLEAKGKSVNRAAFDDTRDEDVLIANALGIVGGYGNGKFGPNNTITRQEAATMLKRLASVMGFERPNSTPVTFSESPSLQAWAKEGIDFISACIDTKNNKRVMGGTDNNKFSPLGSYTREQTFMSIFRLYNAF